MPTTTYDYKVRDSQGTLHKGEIEADNTALVVNKLREMGLTPISVERHNAGFRRELTIPGLGNRVKLKEIAVFSRQFATMIDSGLTLTRSLAILVGQTKSKHLASVIDRMRADIESGLSLSQAMSVRRLPGTVRCVHTMRPLTEAIQSTWWCAVLAMATRPLPTKKDCGPYSRPSMPVHRPASYGALP